MRYSLSLGFVVLGLSNMACSSDDSSKKSTTTAANDPKKAADSTPSETGGSCDEAVKCCDAAATKYPAMSASCDALKKQLESAKAAGTPVSSYEAACKSAVDGYKAASYCN